MTEKDRPPIQVTSFSSFPVNQKQSFDITFANQVKPNDVSVSITNPVLGLLDKQIDWSDKQINIQDSSEGHGQRQRAAASKCRVTFFAPMVGIYSIKIDLLNESALTAQFQARAYDLSKVLINNSSGQCRVNESYEFGVDASEAGEGQLEIAVNEGEIPNQVQVLDNGKCIVSFTPEEVIPHVIDIKFNGHNVIGCPFEVQVLGEHEELTNGVARVGSSPTARLIKQDRVLVSNMASLSLQNLASELGDRPELLVIDPDNRAVEFKMIADDDGERLLKNYKFEFMPMNVGDYAVELKPNGRLSSLLPADLLDQFPFSIKVFDFKRVIVSDVTDGVVGHPIYFFIDASQAGSGNLEIRVSSKTRNVPNYPQSEANAKIRVHFTTTEAVDHLIDVKFNGYAVPNNPFKVRVSQYPQARLPVGSQDLLKYVAMSEKINFIVEHIGQQLANQLNHNSCRVGVLGPDFEYTQLDGIELIRRQADKQAAGNLFKVII